MLLFLLSLLTKMAEPLVIVLEATRDELGMEMESGRMIEAHLTKEERKSGRRARG